MTLGDFFARLGGREEPAVARPTVAGPPTADDLRASLARVEQLVDEGAVPSPVTARARRVVDTVRDTMPRLAVIGTGSEQGYAVMATATDYLPEAIGGYLRLPRRFADSRPVDGGRTALMVLVDQLDLLGATMDRVFDAVCRDDATSLVAHGRFLAEKFGHDSSGGRLDLGAGHPVPPPADDARHTPDTPGTAGTADAVGTADADGVSDPRAGDRPGRLAPP